MEEPELNRLGCLIVSTIFAFNVTIGTISVIEILSWFDKTVPMATNIFMGFLLGEITVPIALCGWVLRLFGVF